MPGQKSATGSGRSSSEPARMQISAERLTQVLRAARSFAKTHGHLQVRVREVVNGVHLGGFLARCRTAYANGRLDPSIAAALEEIAPGWTVTVLGGLGRYQPMLQAAQEYFDAYGHVRVPKAYVAPSGVGLGWWLSDRRNQLRAGTLNPLLQERLSSIDKSWADPLSPWEAKREQYAARMLPALLEFRGEHGHTEIPSRHITADGLRLGKWLQKRRLEKREGKLDATVAKQLREAGVSWTPRSPKRSKQPKRQPEQGQDEA